MTTDRIHNARQNCEPVSLPVVVEQPNRSLEMVYRKVPVARYSSHLGRVFNDGPPTDKNDRVNGLAVKFAPEDRI